MSVSLDGFSIRPTDPIAILKSNDILQILLTPQKEGKVMEIVDSEKEEQTKEIVDSEKEEQTKGSGDTKKERKKKEVVKTKKKERTKKIDNTEKTSLKKKEKEKREKADKKKPVKGSVIIDRSGQKSNEEGIVVPTNCIIRFDAEKQDDNEDQPPLRIRQPVQYNGVNTNTATLNKRSKRIRRGKRAGKKKETPIQPSEQTTSFLDYIVYDPPTIMTSNTLCSTVLPDQSSELRLKEEEKTMPISIIQEPAQEDSIADIRSISNSPSIGDSIAFSHVVLNKQTLCPEKKEVCGVVKK